MYFHGTWTQWFLGRVTYVISTNVGSKVIWGSMTFGSSFCRKGHYIHILWCIFMWLSYNDPWVESHLWPQQFWGQRSSRGQWPFSHLNRYEVKFNITRIAQVCDRESRRDSSFENRLVLIKAVFYKALSYDFRRCQKETQFWSYKHLKFPFWLSIRQGVT